MIRTSHDLIYHASFPPSLPPSPNLRAMSKQQRLFLHAAPSFLPSLRRPSVNRQNSPFDVLARSLTLDSTRLLSGETSLLSLSVFFLSPPDS